jgi:uncharacterized protein YraI
MHSEYGNPKHKPGHWINIRSVVSVEIPGCLRQATICQKVPIPPSTLNAGQFIMDSSLLDMSGTQISSVKYSAFYRFVFGIDLSSWQVERLLGHDLNLRSSKSP